MPRVLLRRLRYSRRYHPGPYPLWVRLTCGLAVDSLHSPCAPLLPVWGVDRARHTVPPPPGRLALPTPPTGTHRTRVRAGLLLLRAAVHSTAAVLRPEADCRLKEIATTQPGGRATAAGPFKGRAEVRTIPD